MRELSNFWKWICRLLIAAWVVIILYTALLGAWHPVIQGAIFLSFSLALVFINFPANKEKLQSPSQNLLGKFLFGSKDSPALFDCLMVIASLVVCIYVLLSWEEITRQRWFYQTYQLVFSGILFFLLIEGTRRTTGNIIPILVICFMAYALFGSFIPGLFGHPGFQVYEILYHFYMMTEGYWGMLTDLTSRVVAIFLLLGPVLFATGVGDTFMNLARFFGGRMSGGAGQISVLSSACFGTLSGSAVANVATTGTFTIPTMKSLGYKSEFAGAVESAASSGGQIMPPIMGVGAFVMAELLGIPYLYICLSAVIPAIIYFFGVGSGVFFYAKKNNLGRVPAELIPKARVVFNLSAIINLIIPIGILLYILFRLLPPQLAAGCALIASMATYSIGGLLSRKPLWGRIQAIGGALYSGAITGVARLMVLSVCVQVAVSLISLTGLAVKMSEVILNLAGMNVILALMLTMVIIMILGMGMPTTAAYIIAAAVLGSTLIGMDIRGISAHMFIFYFAVLANISPPVCVAIYTAVTIAGGNWLRMAFIAMSLCLGGYLIPYVFVFHPPLLMDGEPLSILFSSLSALLGVLFLSAGVFGYFKKQMNILGRICFVTGGLLLFIPGFLTDVLGVVLVTITLLIQWLWQPKPAYNIGSEI